MLSNDTIKELGETSARFKHYETASASVRAVLALNVGRMGSWSWDITNSKVVGDPFFAELLNLDYDDQPWPLQDVFGSIHSEDLPQVQASLDRALQGEADYETEFRDRVVDPHSGQEGIRWLGARGKVTERDADGTPLRMVGLNWDVTPQKTLEARLTMLAAEMDHRVKNAFAVILALIKLGERSSKDMQDLAENLRSQVEAMATAHSLSARLARSHGSPEVPAKLRDLIDMSLSGWRDYEGHAASQINIHCADTIKIPSRKVSPFAMLLYEMATNAAKYGPLSTTTGKIEITAIEKADQSLLLTWDETMPDDWTPQEIEDGFGTILFEHCAMSLGGSIEKEMRESGFHFSLAMPNN